MIQTLSALTLAIGLFGSASPANARGNVTVNIDGETYSCSRGGGSGCECAIDVAGTVG